MVVRHIDVNVVSVQLIVVPSYDDRKHQLVE